MKYLMILVTAFSMEALASGGFDDDYYPPPPSVPPVTSIFTGVKYHCRAINLGAMTTVGHGSPVEQPFDFSPELATSMSVDVSGMRATMGGFKDSSAGGGFRLSLRLSGELANNEVAYSSTSVDGVFPKRLGLVLTVPDTQVVIGMLNCDLL